MSFRNMMEHAERPQQSAMPQGRSAAFQRQELAEPIQVAVGLSRRLLAFADKNEAPADLIDKVGKMCDSGQTLLDLIRAGHADFEAPAAASEEYRRRRRHELLNGLNKLNGFCQLLLLHDQRERFGSLSADLTKIGELCKEFNRKLAYFRNPAPASSPAAPAMADTDLPAGLCAQPGNLLVVDDSPDARELLRELLKAHGNHQVAEAASGAEALDMMADNAFDIVLLDILMPGLNGFEVLQRRKVGAGAQPSSVIVISGVDDLQEAIRCIELGAEGYLTKPIDPALLQARVNACLLKRQFATRIPPIDKPAVPHGAWEKGLPAGLPASLGRYTLHKLLGKGNMGAVYLARDGQLQRSVALKILLGAASVYEERFRREAQAAAMLSHPNLCPVYDFGQIDGVSYLTMAYVEGKPLSEILLEQPQYPIQSAVRLVAEMALAMQEAHDRGVIHRDLKPANVMIDGRGQPIIMDFGLARRDHEIGDTRLTQPGMIMGTPAYMPPEQVKGAIDAMGPACDIYSIGVILYEMLAGRLPFTSGTFAELAAQILKDPPPPPSRFRSDLDPHLEAICLKPLAKEPARRFAAMREFAAALEGYARRNAGRGSPRTVRKPGRRKTHTQKDGASKKKMLGPANETDAAKRP